MKGEFAVEFNDVVKIFPTPEGGQVNAVDHVSIEINHGKFFSLLGPSGCGKTTSLRLMAEFEWPSSGDVLIDGELMGRRPPYQRPVNTVFQNYALFQHMTVYQNVAFGLEMDKVPKDEISRRVNEALEMVKLPGMGRRKPKQLSGGQQQRIALARALAEDSNVVYICPTEGCTIWFDKLAITKGAPHKDAAIQFLNWVLDPQESILITKEYPYSNPNKAALDLLKTDDPTLYESYMAFSGTNPDDAFLANAKPIIDVGDTTALYDSLWTDFKSK
jgi:ABC-type lipoprotein export system ATPase subunit